RAEAALQERLYQANLLNQATARLGASLELEPVLHAIAAATAHLFGSRCVVLQPSLGLDDDAAGLPLVVHCQDLDDAERASLLDDLTGLCERTAEANSWRGREHDVLRLEVLPSGQPALVLALTLPTRQISLATLALTVPQWPAVPAVDPDMVASFIERITLATENASLYRTLARRSNDLQRAYGDLAMAHQELLSVDEMKTNFIANVSHELRTPLSSIRAFSELLLSYDDDPEVQKEFISIVNTESERLTRLVNDVLDISKIEAGRMDWNMTEVDVARLVRDGARTFAPLIEKHGLTFVQDISPDLPPVHGDRDRLHQVVGNLLNNAVKFTPSGTIIVRATCVDDEVHVAVQDTGIGIAPQDQERIFEKFQQVGEMLTDKPGGTGLGLAICREIAVHHGGQLWVESLIGMGSTFTLALKASSQAAPPPVEGDAAGAPQPAAVA
ncbi:MAG: sensor histidine kinase, partial [Chloroflexota bacterium]